mmetsp:Transcript_23894/g.28907  ORF Transcript_23894/g.28907 Transcript_23894/m.28907 type:complete len:352 (+) Transcript_23894:373-1428(+)|eukprot:CAMPEP_0197852698 /NCGR_PEP_ID=MMETSP1438-20131217/21229_1 /TAXON_ID=1461541 /ORGANISM="Pterosperma sp., Strain CCMP1384" /LENGTH=351 /DNA_ID=CAMNT_0043466859 /DNA_START=357 /DNA_END=1412 /DNA_ORIENTATION=-
MKSLVRISVLALLLNLSCLAAANSARARSADLPYIRCSVCQQVSRVLHKRAAAMIKKADNAKLSYDTSAAIHSLMENICDPYEPEGVWIPKTDLKENGTVLQLVLNDQPQKCGVECYTVAKACEDYFSQKSLERDTLSIGADMEAVMPEYIKLLRTNDITRTQLTYMMCDKMSTACTDTIPKLKEGRKPGPEFSPMTEEEKAEFEELKKAHRLKKDEIRSWMEKKQLAMQGLKVFQDAFEVAILSIVGSVNYTQEQFKNFLFEAYEFFLECPGYWKNFKKFVKNFNYSQREKQVKKWVTNFPKLVEKTLFPGYTWQNQDFLDGRTRQPAGEKKLKKGGKKGKKKKQATEEL